MRRNHNVIGPEQKPTQASAPFVYDSYDHYYAHKSENWPVVPYAFPNNLYASYGFTPNNYTSITVGGTTRGLVEGDTVYITLEYDGTAPADTSGDVTPRMFIKPFPSGPDLYWTATVAANLSFSTEIQMAKEPNPPSGSSAICFHIRHTSQTGPIIGTTNGFSWNSNASDFAGATVTSVTAVDRDEGNTIADSFSLLNQKRYSQYCVYRHRFALYLDGYSYIVANPTEVMQNWTAWNLDYDGQSGVYTVEMWIRTDEKTLDGGSNRTFFNTKEGKDPSTATGGGSSNKDHMTFAIGSTDGKLVFKEGSIIQINGAGPVLDDDNWHHIVIMKYANHIYYYCDGVKISRFTPSYTFGQGRGLTYNGASGYARACAPVIGADWDGNGRWKGYIYDVRVSHNARYGTGSDAWDSFSGQTVFTPPTTPPAVDSNTVYQLVVLPHPPNYAGTAYTDVVARSCYDAAESSTHSYGLTHFAHILTGNPLCGNAPGHAGVWANDATPTTGAPPTVGLDITNWRQHIAITDYSTTISVADSIRNDFASEGIEKNAIQVMQYRNWINGANETGYPAVMPLKSAERNINDTSVAISVSISASSSADESTAYFTATISTTGISGSATLYWRIEETVGGGTLNTTDFSATSGSFTVTSNSGSFNIVPLEDSLTDSQNPETFALIISETDAGAAKATHNFTINDTSTGPTEPIPIDMTSADYTPSIFVQYGGSSSDTTRSFNTLCFDISGSAGSRYLWIGSHITAVTTFYHDLCIGAAQVFDKDGNSLAKLGCSYTSNSPWSTYNGTFASNTQSSMNGLTVQSVTTTTSTNFWSFASSTGSSYTGAADGIGTGYNDTGSSNLSIASTGNNTFLVAQAGSTFYAYREASGSAYNSCAWMRSTSPIVVTAAHYPIRIAVAYLLNSYNVAGGSQTAGSIRLRWT